MDLRGVERGAEEHRELARRPAAVDRDPVLRLGDAAHRWPEYRDAVTIMDVYRLTPGGAGTTPGELRAYLERRGGGGKPLA